MHKISQKTAQAAQSHAKQSIEHGKSVEEVGQRLQSSRHFEPPIGQSIERKGQTIQKQAEAALEKAQELTKDDSTEAFSAAVDAHINAANTHIEASREFQKEIQNQLHQPN